MDLHPFTPMRRAGVLVLGVVVLALSAPPAVAEELSVKDGRRDMWIIEEGSTDPAPAAKHEIGDLKRTTYKHSEARVVIRAAFRALRPTGKRFVLWVGMRDQDGHTTYAGVEARRRHREGRPLMFSGSGKEVDCQIRHRIDYERDVVRLGFPRTCVDEPTWLRFRTFDEHTARDWSYAYVDDAHDSEMTFMWSGKVRSG